MTNVKVPGSPENNQGADFAYGPNISGLTAELHYHNEQLQGRMESERILSSIQHATQNTLDAHAQYEKIIHFFHAEKMHENANTYAIYSALSHGIKYKGVNYKLEIAPGKGFTMLTVAAWHWDHSLVDLLLQFDNIDCNVDPEKSPLNLAFTKNHIDTAILIASHPKTDFSLHANMHVHTEVHMRLIEKSPKITHDEKYKKLLEAISNHPTFPKK